MRDSQYQSDCSHEHAPVQVAHQLALSWGTYLRCQEDELEVRVLQAVAEEVLHGNTPVDGVHENIKLIHSTERGLCPLAKSKRKGYCGIALLSTCSPCAGA